jgi:hypothetical protein
MCFVVPSREVTEHAVGRARAGQQQAHSKQAGRQAASSACTGTAALGLALASPSPPLCMV